MQHVYTASAWDNHCKTKGHSEHVVNKLAEKEKDDLKHKTHDCIVSFFIVKKKRTHTNSEGSAKTFSSASSTVDLAGTIEH